MDKYNQHFSVSSSKNNLFWRRVELTDLSKLMEMVTDEIRQAFGFSDIARIIMDNPLSLCQVNSNGEISIFVSLSSYPNINCVSSEYWTEWFNYFYDLNNVEEHNTLFVNVVLFQCVECLINLPIALETIYVQLPEIQNIIIVEVPGTIIHTSICLPFSTLPAKNVIRDPVLGCPKIFYHTRAYSINKIILRTAIVDDFIDLRAYLKTRLDFLDRFYGEYSLAKILEFPGEGRVNLVPIMKVNGLVTLTTSVDYALLDSLFELHQYEGLIKLNRDDVIIPKSILRLPNELKIIDDATVSMVSNNTNNEKEILTSSSSAEETPIDNKTDSSFQSSLSDSFQDDDESFSIESLSLDITMKKRNFNFKNLCDKKLNNITKDFLKFQDKLFKNTNDSTTSSVLGKTQNTISTKLMYHNTAFFIELMLIDENDETKALWDYLIAYFHKFSKYDFCLVNISSMATPPTYKKYFCKVSLKPNRYYSRGQLYLLHRSFLFGKFTCVLVTEEHLKIMEHLIDNHQFKYVIWNNICKSVSKDKKYTYRTYIFQCDSQPIGYCVIRSDDDMKFLSSNFDVARFVYPEKTRNHMAVLLNMDLQGIFSKKSRCFLNYVMKDNNLSCLFYKLYSNSTVMEQCEFSYIAQLEELIPVKPRTRIQYADENENTDYEKFSLFHMNTRLYVILKMPIDAKIVVVGASVVALSFLESLVFNPVNYKISFENIVLISDCGMPYEVSLTDLEDCMAPKVSHFNHEYMKSVGLSTFVDIITGTVTAINRADKYVIVDADVSIYYDYLFLFNGEQFTFSVGENETKSDKHKKTHQPNSEDNTIENLFLLNSERDVMYACRYIETMKNHGKDIIVYGKYLGSLSVIYVLLERNIDGSRIVYMESGDKENLPFITCPYIIKAVYDELKNQGVRVYEQCVFESLKLNKYRTYIQELTVKSNSEQITIKCAGLFWFDQKFIKKVNWLTMIRSSLKFDGHLVVSTSFETNVEFVYAAGPVAKFTRNDFFVTASHVYYNSVEIGVRVANMLMKLLGVIKYDGVYDKYIRPLSIYCRLPGKYNYFHSVVPSLKFMKGSTKRLSTLNADRGYFEIVVDHKGDVLEISCYSKQDFKYLNLINLCGKNVNLFSDMMDRLSTNSIPCFFDYFEEPWAYLLYSDRFWKLLDEIKRKLKRNDKDVEKFLGESIIELTSMYNAKTMAELLTCAGLDGRFERIYGQKLQNILIKFIDDNIDDFPKFSHIRDAVDQMNSMEGCKVKYL